MLAYAKRWLSPRTRAWLRFQLHRFTVFPPVGAGYFGTLGATRPVSATFGYNRGAQIDRFYIEGFLRQHAADIKGVVLEVASNPYTREFGGERVARSEILHLQPGVPGVTIVADLTADEGRLGTDRFDCIILTQTLQFIYEPRLAIATLYRALRPGGVLLATVPGISQISRFDMQRWGDFWRFTDLSMQRLLAEQFGESNLNVRAHGNVFAAVALLHGLAQEDVGTRKLAPFDPDYQVIVTARAVKQADAR